MTLRVNASRSNVTDYLTQLQAVGLSGHAVGEFGIELTKAAPVQQLPGFAQGMVSVQDAAAQWAAPLLLQGLDTTQSLRILDACAAPGGKTGHLLEMCPSAQVTALDVDPARCERVQHNLDRLQVQAQVIAADAAQPATWWDGAQFDAILLDAPCTASGIGRRHPDVRCCAAKVTWGNWLPFKKAAANPVAPAQTGGHLVYCTCSIFLAEGHSQIQTFLQHNTDAVFLPSPGHLMPQNRKMSPSVQDNQTGEHDGFYYARLQKRP